MGKINAEWSEKGVQAVNSLEEGAPTPKRIYNAIQAVKRGENL